MKIAIVATSLLLATAIPATAGHYGGGGDTNWGAVAGAGILGALSVGRASIAYGDLIWWSVRVCAGAGQH